MIAAKPIYTLRSLGLPTARGQEDYVSRVIDQEIDEQTFNALAKIGKNLGVTDEFIKVIDYFKTESGHTPAGFRIETRVEPDGLVAVDLVRDISWDSDGRKRPTKVLFSADSANPYEVAPISNLLANLTCNPGIIYDLFINNPEANVGNKFTTRDEVMEELGRVLGPGCDISVELNNPFARDINEILEEAAKFREMLSEYRVVIKVPHTGAVNASNVNQLLTGDGRLDVRYDKPGTEDALRGHNLALLLHEHGFRVNFTLMFEPYQTQLALQARPYFINTFLRHRLKQSEAMSGFLKAIDGGDDAKIADLRNFMLANDYLSAGQDNLDAKEVLEMARWVVKYRQIDEGEGLDGLDAMRHDLRALRNANMPDTRLIVCSMEGPDNYPDIDKLLNEPEFLDMNDRIVITAEPSYLARFTSTNQVTSYQRRFMKAAEGES